MFEIINDNAIFAKQENRLDIDDDHVLCSFSFEKNKYIIFLDDDLNCDCKKIKFSLWNGAFLLPDDVDERVEDVANKLLDKHDDESGLYPMDHEHYNVTKSDGQLSFEKRRPLLMWKWSVSWNISFPFITHLFVALAMAILYSLFIVNFTRDGGFVSKIFNVFTAKVFLYFLMVLQTFGVTILYFLRMERWSFLSLCLNTFIPYNLFLLVCLCAISTEVRIAVIVIVVAALIFLILPKFISLVRSEEKSEKRRNFFDMVRRLYIPLVVCCCVAYIAFRFFGTDIYAAYSVKKISNDKHYTQVAESFDAFSRDIDDAAWKNYSDDKKLEILNMIGEYECIYTLGCSMPKIVVADLSDIMASGLYKRSTDVITIDREHFDNGAMKSVVGTLLHELRHAYQHAVVAAIEKAEDCLTAEELSLECFRGALAFKENFEDYVDANDDVVKYYFQSIEQDSRDWAEKRLKEDYNFRSDTAYPYR